MPLHAHESSDKSQDLVHVRPQFTQFGYVGDVPRFRLAPTGIPAPAAYQIVHDELLLDGNVRLNLATFVTTWMEREAEVLMAGCADKNLVDKDEYPPDRRARAAVREHPCRPVACLVGRGGHRLLDDMHVLRIVVRDGFARDLAAMLLADLAHVITHLDGRGPAGDGKVRAGFHH